MPKLGMTPIRRAQILPAATHIVSEKGFERTTMRDVAAAAGVSTGTIHHYFRNRLGLLLETLVFSSERFRSRLRTDIDPRVSPEEKVRVLVRLLFGSPEAVEEMKVWIAVFDEAIRSAEVRTVVQERMRLWANLLGELAAEWAGRPLSQEETRRFAIGFDALTNGLSLHVLVMGDVDLDAIERMAIEFVTSSLGPPQSRAVTSA